MNVLDCASRRQILKWLELMVVVATAAISDG